MDPWDKGSEGSVAAREKNANITWRKETEEGGGGAGHSVNGTDLRDLWTAKRGLSSEKQVLTERPRRKALESIPFKLRLGRKQA